MSHPVEDRNPTLTLTTSGHFLAYMPHSGVVHLGIVQGATFGVLGTVTTACGGTLNGAVSLTTVPSCYSRCALCAQAVQA